MRRGRPLPPLPLLLPPLLLLLLAPGARASGASRPHCPRGPAQCLQGGNNGATEYTFTVNGITVFYEFDEGDYFNLRCPIGITLDEQALPIFEPKLVVKDVWLACPAPATSYAEVLHALNVSLPGRLVLIGGAPRSRHLAGLGRITNLELRNIYLEPGSLDIGRLDALQTLRIVNVNITTADIQRLPAGLERLYLVSTRVGRIIANFSHLRELVVIDEAPVTVEPAGVLRSLTINSPDTDVGWVLPDTLVSLSLWGWAPRRPLPWRACAALEELELRRPALELLPRDWLGACPNLRNVTVREALRLVELQEGVLDTGAKRLKRLELSVTALEALPERLLDYTPDLRVLNLWNNSLSALPHGLFLKTEKLTELILSWNNLNGSVLDSLHGVKSLRVLRLDGNRALDACPGARDLHVARTSPLRELGELEDLNLSSTATSSVCLDWRALPRLRSLLLRASAFTSLSYMDLKFSSASKVTIDLTGANVTHLDFDKLDYEEVAKGNGLGVDVKLSQPLACDCSLYWAAAALRAPGARVRVAGATCGEARALRSVPLDELLCAAPGACATNCTCRVRPDTRAPHAVLQLHCVAAGLRRVPRVDVPAAFNTSDMPVALDLRLAGNRIDSLSSEDLPSDLTSLDLRDNLLSLIDETTAKALVSRTDRTVWLAGNPLRCDCSAAAALGAVRSQPQVFPDRGSARCVGGESLQDAALAPPPPCAAPAPLPAAVVAAMVLVVVALAALALVLTRPELRLRVKGALRARGLLPRAREHDDGRRYDAFVSFAHPDEEVVRELVEQLESGAAPLRLCVHYRDWVPGGWIPAQIAASVRASRRTVAVVSAHFLRSAWARAEFREAYAAALRDAEPRLVVVLLDEPARLPLDAELRAYLAANTYVRWGDPWFWNKLRRALPAPRPHPRASRPRETLVTVDEAAATCAAADAVSAPTAENTPAPVADARSAVNDATEHECPTTLAAEAESPSIPESTVESLSTAGSEKTQSTPASVDELPSNLASKIESPSTLTSEDESSSTLASEDEASTSSGTTTTSDSLSAPGCAVPSMYPSCAVSVPHCQLLSVRAGA